MSSNTGRWIKANYIETQPKKYSIDFVYDTLMYRKRIINVLLAINLFL